MDIDDDEELEVNAFQERVTEEQVCCLFHVIFVFFYCIFYQKFVEIFLNNHKISKNNHVILNSLWPCEEYSIFLFFILYGACLWLVCFW
jgi:hypothetical protein